MHRWLQTVGKRLKTHKKPKKIGGFLTKTKSAPCLTETPGINSVSTVDTSKLSASLSSVVALGDIVDPLTMVSEQPMACILE